MEMLSIDSVGSFDDVGTRYKAKSLIESVLYCEYSVLELYKVLHKFQCCGFCEIFFEQVF